MRKLMYCLVAVVLLSVVSIGVALAGKPASSYSAFTIDNTARKHVNDLTITAYEALDMFVLYAPNSTNITSVAAPEGWLVTVNVPSPEYNYWEIIWTASEGSGLSPIVDTAGNVIPDSLSGFEITVSRRTTSANIYGYVLDDENADSLFSSVSYIQVANMRLTLR